MTKARTRPFTALAVLLPLLALGFGVVRSEIRLSASTDWELTVRGFDPRDLLRGHYIRYRIDFQEQGGSGSCALDEPTCCYCLNRTTAEPGDALTPLPTVTRMTCTAARTACDGLLRTRSAAALNRYYVPESRARAIEDQLRAGAADGEARIVLAIDGMGRPHVKELRVAGQRLE